MVDKSKFFLAKTMNCSSLLPQNLQISPDGKNIVTVKNTERGAMILLYGTESIQDESAQFVQPESSLCQNPTDCWSARFIKIQKTTLLVLCQSQQLLIFNQNQSRLLFKFEIATPHWFTSACLAFSQPTGEEFIAVGASNGTVYRVSVGANASNFVKDNGHSLGEEYPITGLAACPKSRSIVVATADSTAFFFKPQDGSKWEQIGKSEGPKNSSCLLAECMPRRFGNLFLLGYTNGLVSLFSTAE